MTTAPDLAGPSPSDADRASEPPQDRVATPAVVPEPRPAPADPSDAPAGGAEPAGGPRLADVTAELRRRGEEIDVLQIELARTRRPFYRDPAVVVAVLALVASVLATYLSTTSSATDRLIQERVRLTTLVQGVADTKLKQGQLAAELGEKAPIVTVAAIGPMLDEGSFLIHQLEGTPYVSTPYEKMVIATGYVDVNEPATAADLLILAENEARSQGQQVTQKLDAARLLAVALFQVGRPEDGRAAYRRALGYAAQASQGYDQGLRAAFLYETNSKWAWAELRANNCAGVREHAAAARADLATFPLSGAGAYPAQQNALESYVASVCP